MPRNKYSNKLQEWIEYSIIEDRSSSVEFVCDLICQIMEVFGILKILAQVLGVFPFKQKKSFYISKLYLGVNIFVGICLVITAGLVAKTILQEEVDSKEFVQAREYPLYSITDKLLKSIIFGRMTASLTAVMTKFIYRRKYVINLNAVLEFFREYKVNSILNTTVRSDYFFIIFLCVSLAIEISSTTIDMMGPHKSYLAYNSGVKFQIILDEIMFCAVCSTLAKYQLAIKQMILSLTLDGETEEIIRDNANIAEIVMERQIKRSYGRCVSAKAQKLECFRKLNLKILNIYSNYSALHKYQLFVSTAVSTMEITNTCFSLFAVFTQHISLDSYFIIKQTVQQFGHLASSLIRIFMLCYYNDKAFNEGVAIKYTVQEIRQASSEKDVIKVSKIFIEQMHSRRQVEICGVFAFNMTLPVTFMGYALNYAVVLVQYLGLKI